jgi:hypothetical protein
LRKLKLMGKTYNWAILGCGKIARKFSSDLKLLPNARLYAAAARDLQKAQAFAGEMGFEKAYGSYEAMLADPEVDVVYVATPHSHHYEHVLMCLHSGKAVLNRHAKRALPWCFNTPEESWHRRVCTPVWLLIPP